MGSHSKILAIPLLLAAACTNPGPPRVIADSGSDTGQFDASSPDASSPDASTMPDTQIPPGDAGAEDMTPANLDKTGRSGTRLRRVYLDAGQGATMTVSFYDTELEVNCTFREASDGAVRCLPQRQLINTVYYSDPGCMAPVHQVSESWCEDVWSKEVFSGEIYRATDTPAVLNNTKYRRSTDGTCVESVVDPDTPYFAAELMPATEFVRGVSDDQPRAGDLVARYLDGEDGSRLLYQTLHSRRGYECDFSETGRCLPDKNLIRPNVDAFADENCTQPLYGFTADEPPPLMEISSRDGNDCPINSIYYELGFVENDPAYVLQNESCVMLNSSSYSFYYRGAPVPLEEFPAGIVESEGTGELVARRYIDEAGDPLGAPFEFYDNANDQSCGPFETGEGEAVCMPTDFAVIDGATFLDEACSVPYAFGTKTCDPATPDIIADTSIRACEIAGISRVFRAFEVGSPTGPDVYFSSGGNCNATTLNATTSAWATGARVLDTLPRLDVLTE